MADNRWKAPPVLKFGVHRSGGVSAGSASPVDWRDGAFQVLSIPSSGRSETLESRPSTQTSPRASSSANSRSPTESAATSPTNIGTMNGMPGVIQTVSWETSTSRLSLSTSGVVP
jgi:hypothetical protein